MNALVSQCTVPHSLFCTSYCSGFVTYHDTINESEDPLTPRKERESHGFSQSRSLPKTTDVLLLNITLAMLTGVRNFEEYRTQRPFFATYDTSFMPPVIFFF